LSTPSSRCWRRCSLARWCSRCTEAALAYFGVAPAATSICGVRLLDQADRYLI
jgi:hypothetical protein